MPVVLPPLFLAVARECVKNEKLVLLGLRLTMWFQSGLMATQYYACSFECLGKPFGNLSNNTLMGAFMASLLPIALAKWSRWEVALLTLVCLACDSTMTIVAMVGGIGAYIWFKHTWRALSVMVPMVMAAITIMLLISILPNHDAFNFNGRLPVWAQAWHWIQQRPTGWGPGAWLGLDTRWNVQYHELWAQLHSDWLQLLFEGGFPALGLCIIFTIHVFTRSKPMWLGCYAALIVNCLANFPLHFFPTAFLMALAIAALYKHEGGRLE